MLLFLVAAAFLAYLGFASLIAVLLESHQGTCDSPDFDFLRIEDGEIQ